MNSHHAFAINFQSGQIDRAAGVIRGVAVITEGVANGLVIDALTIQQIKQCSETYANGLKVVDRHTKGTDSVFSTVGALRNFVIDGKTLRADLYPLKTELNSGKLFEMAESIPDTFGLSVAFSGPNEVRDGAPFARCTEIYNCALVDTPAAQRGLFSDDKAGLAAPVMVDATRSGKTNTMADNTQPDYEARFKKLEDAVSEMVKKLSAACVEPDGDEANDLAETKKTIAELSAKVAGLKELSDKIADRDAFAQTIAREFSKHVGASAPVAPAPVAGNTAPVEPSPVEKFVALAKKHFAATKSKTEALKLAMKEDAPAYKAFRESGADIKWA